MRPSVPWPNDLDGQEHGAMKIPMDLVLSNISKYVFSLPNVETSLQVDSGAKTLKSSQFLLSGQECT